MLIYDEADAGPTDTPRKTARTHALIIGVGYYHHLLGGGGQLTKWHWDLQQLTSPPASAVAFAEWVIGTMNNPNAPLGSVELLVSPEAEYKFGNLWRHIESARLQNVQLAFDRWITRCNDHEGNIAILYFCGHGICREHTALLLEDYGARNNNPMAGAINLEDTHLGMAKCRAGVQCFFVDSCRQTPFTATKMLRDSAIPLIQPEIVPYQFRDAPIYFSAAPGTTAYGQTGAITRFTDILLKCLNGRAAVSRPGQVWAVTTGRLIETLSGAMGEENSAHEDYPQHSTTSGSIVGTSVLHQLSNSPEVKVSLCCSPEPANYDALFRLISPSMGVGPYSSGPGLGTCSFSVTAGYYKASASFANGRWSTAECDVWAHPPGPVHEILRVAL